MVRTRRNDVVSEFESAVVLQAQYFTVFEMHQGERIRQEFWPDSGGPVALAKALRAAVVAKGNNPRAGIYAVRADGRNVCISPQDYDRYVAELEARCAISEAS